MSPNSDIAKPEEIKSQSVKPASAKANVTLKLDKELVRKVRLLAAEKGAVRQCPFGREVRRRGKSAR